MQTNARIQIKRTEFHSHNRNFRSSVTCSHKNKDQIDKIRSKQIKIVLIHSFSSPSHNAGRKVLQSLVINIFASNNSFLCSSFKTSNKKKHRNIKLLNSERYVLLYCLHIAHTAHVFKQNSKINHTCLHYTVTAVLHMFIAHNGFI